MKTAIVVAHNPQNAGMYSVDLGRCISSRA